MKKIFISAIIFVFLNSCCEDVGKNVSIKIFEMSRVLNIDFKNDSGDAICIPSSYLKPSATADGEREISEGEMLWRSQQRLLINGEMKAKSDDALDYTIVIGSASIIRYLDPDLYPIGSYNIVIDGTFCKDLFSDRKYIEAFTIHRSITL
jgi:hypothetical protein